VEAVSLAVVPPRRRGARVAYIGGASVVSAWYVAPPVRGRHRSFLHERLITDSSEANHIGFARKVKRSTGREGVGGVGLGSVTSNARIDRARVWINVGEPNVSPSNPAAFIPNSVGI